MALRKATRDHLPFFEKLQKSSVYLWYFLNLKKVTITTLKLLRYKLNQFLKTPILTFRDNFKMTKITIYDFKIVSINS